MALTEKQYINKIEFLYTGDVQVRESTEVYRDEQMIAQEYHRRVVSSDEQLDGPLAERLEGIQLEVVAERNSLREEKAQLEAEKEELQKTVEQQVKDLEGLNLIISRTEEDLESERQSHQKTVENYELLEESKKVLEDELALVKQELENLKLVEEEQEVQV